MVELPTLIGVDRGSGAVVRGGMVGVSCEVMNWVESNSPRCLGSVMHISTKDDCGSVVVNGGIFGSMMCKL